MARRRSQLRRKTFASSVINRMGRRARYCFFFSSRRRHTRLQGDWSSDVCSSDLAGRTTLVLPRDPQRGKVGQKLKLYMKFCSVPEQWNRVERLRVLNSDTRVPTSPDRKSVV